jgi:hypothetical protein
LGLGAAPASPERHFRVRLHFADPDNQNTGTRKFDINLQNRTVLSSFDIVAEAGATNSAVVKEFDNEVGSKLIIIDLSPNDMKSTNSRETILSGIEIEETSPTGKTP